MVLGFQSSTYINSVFEFSSINCKCSLYKKISAEQRKQNQAHLFPRNSCKLNLTFKKKKFVTLFCLKVFKGNMTNFIFVLCRVLKYKLNWKSSKITLFT